MENLITDRTQEDVNRAILLNQKDYLSMSDDEKNEWNAGLKGSYNVSDLNRVGTEVTSAGKILTDESGNVLLM